jgi:nitroimidazol reductase NimA-like FMN-containing flavoprotein (pyridoxamine 5'-phosphate oxidase superfamily)
MVIEEMSKNECDAMLRRAHVARLACAWNNQPYIVPIHVDFEDGYLYGFATAGQKIEWMRRNPSVCVAVDELATRDDWTSIVVMGSYEELPPTPESSDTRRIAERLFQKHPMWWEPASVLLASDECPGLVVFRIRINRVTGRRARPDTPPTPVHTAASARAVTRTRWFVQRLRISWQRRES